MTVKLIGADDGVIDGSTGNSNFCLYKFTASATGTCSEIRIKLSADGHVKVGIYADSAGFPGARLAKQNTSTAVITGWNTVALEASCYLVSGTAYWLAFNSDASNIGYDLTTGPGFCYVIATYATFTFPDPAGTWGFPFPLTNTIGFIAGWGLLVVPRSFGFIIG